MYSALNSSYVDLALYKFIYLLIYYLLSRLLDLNDNALILQVQFVRIPGVHWELGWSLNYGHFEHLSLYFAIYLYCQLATL